MSPIMGASHLGAYGYGFEQLQIFIEPKGSQLLDKDAWKERFLLQMNDNAVPVKVFADDNNYKIWGFHFYNQDNRMREFDADFELLTRKTPLEYNVRQYAEALGMVADDMPDISNTKSKNKT